MEMNTLPLLSCSLSMGLRLDSMSSLEPRPLSELAISTLELVLSQSFSKLSSNTGNWKYIEEYDASDFILMDFADVLFIIIFISQIIFTGSYTFASINVSCEHRI